LRNTRTRTAKTSVKPVAHELLGIFLVPLERGIRHDTLDPILLTLAGVHRHAGASEEDGLERNDRNPGAPSGPTLPEGPREADGQGRNHEGKAERQVHDCGMQW
jgi:hypothetical protein